MANCKSCKDNEQIPEHSKEELAFAFAERMVKRLWIATIILIFMLVGTNAAWIWYESQFEEIEIVQENEEGYNSFIGNDGDIVYGETDGENP